MNRILLRALMALAAAWLIACNSIAPRPKPTDKPSPMTNVSSGGEVEASTSMPRFGDITVRDSTSTTQTMRTTVMGDGDHVPHHIPTDTAGDTLNFYTEDAAVTEGGTGVGILARRNDALATTTSADGDMTYLSASLSGELLTLDETVLAAIQLMHNEIAPAFSAEDAVYAEGSIGLTILARVDSSAGSSATEGDNATLNVTTEGDLRTATTLSLATVNPYIEATALAIDSSSSATSAVMDVRGYSACWFEAEFDGSVTGSLEVWMANTSAGATAATAEKMPIYDLLAGDGLACSQVANGDREIDVDYTDAGTNALCRWRMPQPLSYAAVRWIRATGGGAAGLTVRTSCRAF